MEHTLKVSEIIAFLVAQGDKRITPEALEYYKDWRLETVVTRQHSDTGELVGVSLAGITLEYQVIHSVTVVHADHRNKGIGAQLLQQKIFTLDLCEGVHDYRAVVAEDNLPSNRICQKVGLVIADTLQRKRTAGPYTANVYSSRKQSDSSTDAEYRYGIRT